MYSKTDSFNYSRELNMLEKTFDKMHLPFSISADTNELMSFFEGELGGLFKGGEEVFKRCSELVEDIEENNLYKFTLFKHLKCLIFLLPGIPGSPVMFIGPYLTASPGDEQLLEIAELAGVAPGDGNPLSAAVLSLPTIPEDSHIFFMLDTFLEGIWGSSDYSIFDIESEKNTPPLPLTHEEHRDSDNILLSISAMEKRYKHENMLIDAVKHGQIGKLNFFMSSFSAVSFEKRLTDPVRNLKNYGIIMNTLLRKAAEGGGVHPVYIDTVSGGYARRLEAAGTEGEISHLMSEMYSGYCRLVRKHSMKSYTQPVRRAIIYIDANLSGNLSLSAVAETQSLSPGYLSGLFRKEVGVTLTDFVAERRIEKAKQLLETTELQIQTIALYCGIVDVQYFTKFFKKHTGKTPREFRTEIRHGV